MNLKVRFCWPAIIALLFTTNAHALLYWDVNGNTPGSGGPSPSGTWNLSAANFSNDNDIGSNVGTWGNGDSIAFSAGTDATGSYTVTVDNSFGQVIVADMHCDDGTPTLAGSPLMWQNNSQLISALPGHVFTINCVLTNSATNTEAFHKYKMGTLVLGASNTFKGDVTIEGGTVAISGNQRIPATSGLVLTNGDDRSGDGLIDTPATFNTGGFNQSLGQLILNGPNSLVPRTIDFSNGHGTLSFANSSANAWTTTANTNNNANPGAIVLTITNFSIANARLRFGTSSSGLTAAQLGQIQFADYMGLPGVIDSNGFVTPELPAMQPVTISGSTVHITWSAVPNWTYQLQYRNDFSSAWQSLGNFSSNGNSITEPDTLTAGTRYYRVQVIAPP